MKNFHVLIDSKERNVISTSIRDNLSSGFRQGQTQNNMPLLLQRAATGLEFQSSILKHRTAKTLIRPRECVGWSVPLLIGSHSQKPEFLRVR